MRGGDESGAVVFDKEDQGTEDGVAFDGSDNEDSVS